MKVNQLSSALLDYWVARAEGNLANGSTSPEDAFVEHYGYGGEVEFRSSLSNWKPSTDWDEGGPIIDRVPFGIFERVNGGWGAGIYRKQPGMRDLCVAYQIGDTLLIAAMRAYVASKFGDEVPDEE
ncbi:phage protein NinX family protein [Burkholderia sp. BCCIQ04A]|uniref:Phage protein NinX family protein n=1 Tax=Burkholderia anthinoferrum TaxID=3090833 RepID=A0ABU5WNS4_9BURK|nr:phage protein NinX family protein [Burkholderia anthinoferrum]MEB2504625.1 phage protein NinX family protein [Burkholderia anthinoferrum]MEB2530294.1 phage protein NinX family protein [Burkholderia anthinoferrum]MEB2561667.1 phage protein NinX family protein [Burkholderia anthinoferrum]MEB2580583.1 phage protein NinX family protein [Burkholderia anthinoferrum]MEB2634439.1 phage protein NinX family protein [Burkholderia anthinoferrum]